MLTVSPEIARLAARITELNFPLHELQYNSLERHDSVPGLFSAISSSPPYRVHVQNLLGFYAEEFIDRIQSFYHSEQGKYLLETVALTVNGRPSKHPEDGVAYQIAFRPPAGLFIWGSPTHEIFVFPKTREEAETLHRSASLALQNGTSIDEIFVMLRGDAARMGVEVRG